ncbi:hypothetical protein MSAN_01106800 [Mycena sanguinolenta]|uniref:Uncharacterized protein n=1 Tax=Mycena sanguinolenta TaxID=230812 RepID=A0A8H6YTD0_9AGAR|nr:hypothetical protein MSAN_01106800 [Mycena sanguinolenta]
MKLFTVSALLALTQVAMAQDFLWRLYNNGGCDHSSPASATFPPDPDAPGTGSFSQCIDAPQGLPWTNVEVNLDDVTTYVFCNDNCGGAELQSVDQTCSGVVPGCVIGSFIVFPTPS